MADANGPEGGANGDRPAYLGIGCVTAVAGAAGGGMLAVLIAKVVGAATKCAADAETGAPCGWAHYWIYGAIVGVIGLPALALWRLRRGRQRSRNSDRG